MSEDESPKSARKLVGGMFLVAMMVLGGYTLVFQVGTMVYDNIFAPTPQSWMSVVNGTIANVGFEQSPDGHAIFTVVVQAQDGSHYLFPNRVIQNLVVGGCVFVYQETGVGNVAIYRFDPCHTEVIQAGAQA